MGWCFTSIDWEDNKKSVKDLVIRYIFNGNTEDIYYIEQRGNDVWVIERAKNNSLVGGLFMTSKKNFEFGYKDIGITCCPYRTSCSRKFYNMIKEIYADYLKDNESSKWLQEWLELWENENNAKAERKELIKNLKVGDTIEFTKARYADKARWTITNIDSKGNFVFDGWVRLRGWKKQDFIKV